MEVIPFEADVVVPDVPIDVLVGDLRGGSAQIPIDQASVFKDAHRLDVFPHDGEGVVEEKRLATLSLHPRSGWRVDVGVGIQDHNPRIGAMRGVLDPVPFDVSVVHLNLLKNGNTRYLRG